LILRQRFKRNGLPRRRKARLIARGYKLQASLDYFKTFASVVQYTTLRILLAKAAKEDLEINHIDINTIFLNLLLKEAICLNLEELEQRELFKQVYPELIGLKEAYLLLNKALYGLKQALREWFFIVK